MAVEKLLLEFGAITDKVLLEHSETIIVGPPLLHLHTMYRVFVTHNRLPLCVLPFVPSLWDLTARSLCNATRNRQRPQSGSTIAENGVESRIQPPCQTKLLILTCWFILHRFITPFLTTPRSGFQLD